MENKKKFFTTNIALVLLVIFIAAVPLFLVQKGEFAGSDDKGTEEIQKIDKNYKPWFKPIWEPPSGEVESLLFAVQAGMGAGFLGYFLGLAKGKKSVNEKEKGKC
ncbi:MAG: energy-coupling factor ABC transporter substrate-binding protein [Thermoanaerobacteraceae bacterium]|nr:energy-coupling factor ABC transporter substrate-binding protein [Thermoanaerobacteraceae bacterium]